MKELFDVSRSNDYRLWYCYTTITNVGYWSMSKFVKYYYDKSKGSYNSKGIKKFVHASDFHVISKKQQW